MRNAIRYALWVLLGGGLGFGAYYLANRAPSEKEKP